MLIYKWTILGFVLMLTGCNPHSAETINLTTIATKETLKLFGVEPKLKISPSFRKMSDQNICLNSTGGGNDWLIDEPSQKYVKEAKRRDLSCGLTSNQN